MTSMLIIVFFLSFLFLGIPVVGAMGLGAVVYILGFMNIPMNIVANQMLGGVGSYTLMAIPFFIISGALMESGGISRRIISFSTALVGGLPGGLALVVIVASAFFAAMTGSGAACVAAIGGMMIPALVKNGYDIDFATALQAAGGTLGPMIPPSILMVLYSVSTGNSVGDMLLAGLLPGILIAVSMMVVTIIISVKKGYKGGDPFSMKRVLSSFKESIWALLTPVTILGGIYSGIFTPTEAAAFSCFYAMFVGFFIYKELTLKSLLKCLYNAIKGTGIILSIVAVTQLFSWIMTREGLPQQIALMSTSISSNPQVFMLIITFILIVVGMFLDPVPAVLIFAPILTPSAIAMGIDPIHFGVVMIATFCMGLVTPPVGMTLFVASNIAHRPVLMVSKKVLPFLLSMLVAVVFIVLFPQISLLLPSLGK